MSCSRSFDIDLAAFLRDPRAPELADFVDHYPRCPSCAVEVRVWTDVHLALAPPHPPPAQLLAYQDGGLPDVEREAVARHVAGCRSCGDELRALGHFEQPALATSVAVERPVPPAARPGRSVLRGVWRTVWHPAFAYAAALLLVLPTLIERARWHEPQTGRVASVDASKTGQAAPGERLLRADEDEARPPVQPPPPIGAAPAARQALPGTLLSATPKSLEPPAVSRLVPRSSGDVQLVEIPLPPAVRESTSLHVRVRDVGGSRELRQRFERPHGDTLTVRLPSVWLSAGAYEIEVRGADDEAEPAARFSVVVR